jgi:hypothetical protein
MTDVPVPIEGLHFSHHVNVGSPIVVVEWLILLLRIQEVQGSYLGSEFGYAD